MYIIFARWYMLKSESVLENETHKLHWDFEIWTNPQIPTRRLHQVIINKKMIIWWIVDVAVPAKYRIKIKANEKKNDKYLDLARELKKAVEHECYSVASSNYFTWNDPQSLRKSSRRDGIRRTSGNYPIYRFVWFHHKTEKSAGELRRLAVTQTPVKRSSANAGKKNSKRVIS